MVLGDEVRGNSGGGGSDETWLHETMGLLFGNDDRRRSAAYTATLNELQPFMDPARPAWLPVSVHLELFDADAVKDLRAVQGFVRNIVSVSGSVAAVGLPAQISGGPLPRLCLDALWFRWMTVSLDQGLDPLGSLLATLPIQVSELQLRGDPSEASGAAFQSFIVAALHSPDLPHYTFQNNPHGTLGALQSITLVKETMEADRLASFFSALPFANSIRTHADVGVRIQSG